MNHSLRRTSEWKKTKIDWCKLSRKYRQKRSIRIRFWLYSIAIYVFLSLFYDIFDWVCKGFWKLNRGIWLIAIWYRIVRHYSCRRLTFIVCWIFRGLLLINSLVCIQKQKIKMEWRGVGSSKIPRKMLWDLEGGPNLRIKDKKPAIIHLK